MSESIDFDMDVHEEEVTKLFVEIGGEDVPAGTALDFLNAVEGATSFNSLRYTRKYDRVAEAFEEVGVIETDVRGSWFVADEDARAECVEWLRDEFEKRM